jgi:hypothetical protein
MEHFDWSSAKKMTLTASEKATMRSVITKHIAQASGQQLQSAIALTADEKQEIKQGIVQHIRTASANAHATNTPWIVHITNALKYHLGYALFTILFICTSTMGAVAYSAESAVPGDTLYSLKLNLNEPVIGALKFSKHTKANWQAKKLERRMHEMQSVVNDPTREQHFTPTLERLEQYTSRMEQYIATLDADQQVELRERLEQSIEHHKQRLESGEHLGKRKEHRRTFSEVLQKQQNRFAPPLQELRRPPPPPHRQ